MFERFTDQAREAIVRAQQEARRLGDGAINPGHLLFGLVAVDTSIAQLALARLGVTLEALREAWPASASVAVDGSPAADGGPAPGAPVPGGPVPGGTVEPPHHIPFDAGTKAALECALREAIALRSPTMTTGHLLVGVLAQRPAAVRPAAPSADPAATGAEQIGTAVDGITVDMDAVRAAVLEQHVSWRSAEASPRILGGWRLGAAPDRLPGRFGPFPMIVMDLLWYAVLATAVAAITWDEAGPETFGAFLLLAAALFGLIGAARTKRAIFRQVARSPRSFDPPDEVAAALARRGLTTEIRLSTGSHIRDRCYRWGSATWIVLSARTISQPQALGFVTGHEVAHLLRNDFARRWVLGTLGPGLLVGAYITLDPRAWLVAFLGVIGYQVVTRWWTELACDAFAVRWAGAAAMRAWAEDHKALLRQPQNRRRRRLRRVRNVMSHPPLALRVALHRDRQSPSR